MVANFARHVHEVSIMVKPKNPHTRFERARIIGARALQIGMGAPLNAPEDVLREAFKEELVSLYGHQLLIDSNCRCGG